jgi:hypothetical protein
MRVGGHEAVQVGVDENRREYRNRPGNLGLGKPAVATVTTVRGRGEAGDLPEHSTIGDSTLSTCLVD